MCKQVEFMDELNRGGLCSETSNGSIKESSFSSENELGINIPLALLARATNSRLGSLGVREEEQK